VLAFVLLRDRARLPLVAGMLAIAAFSLLALGGLAVITRYLLLTGVIASIFCAVAVFGWMLLAPGARRTAWMAAGALVAVVLIVFAPAQADRVNDLGDKIAHQDRIQADLHDLADSGAFEPGCAPVSVPNSRPVPMLALWLDRPPSGIVPGRRVEDGELVGAEPLEGYYVRPAFPEIGDEFELDPNDPGERRGRVPPGFEFVEVNESWELFAACR
jgi:hypothetical protein